jgi:hypothetical protein
MVQAKKNIPRGLKSSDFPHVIGTTKVVPFQNNEFFRNL